VDQRKTTARSDAACKRGGYRDGATLFEGTRASENHTIQLFIGHDFGIILVRDILFNTDFRKKDVSWIQPLDG